MLLRTCPLESKCYIKYLTNSIMTKSMDKYSTMCNFAS